ncbi:MAG: glycosyltransferase family 9 protein, partial [Gemmatimonadota bacterium]
MIQTAFLGDVVLTTPLLSSLARRHGPVDVVTTPAASSLLAHHPAVSQVIPYDKRGQDAGWGGLFRLGRTLRSNRYDRVYLPHRSWRTGALARIAGIPERVGFDDGARIFYTVTVPR